MTSSLVGSEMCIRDSPTDTNFGQGAPNLAVRGVAGRPRILAGECTTSPCLLYTSDAADDM
eukprot:7878624-Prorocentrum_lima.AAC.1